MSNFIWVYGENGQPFVLNTDHIECADKGGEYVEVRMVSGQTIQVQGTVEEFGTLLPGNPNA